jgi:hypothetical protein
MRFMLDDDFLGGGTKELVRQPAAVVHEIIRGDLGPTGLSAKKNVHAQVADILGILTSMTKRTHACTTPRARGSQWKCGAQY